MAARTLSSVIAAVVLVVLAACASDDDQSVEAVPPRAGPVDSTPAEPTTTTGTPRMPEDGILAVWTMSGGECGAPCAFTGTFRADGTLLWSSGRGGAVVEFDPAEAIAVNGSLSADALTDGADDCGREVDGNAPSLLVRDRSGDPLGIDTCYASLRPDHPFTRLTEEPVDRARSSASPPVARVSVPQDPCDPVTIEVCPVLVHELFESGLVIISAPSALADAAPAPIGVGDVAPGLAPELRGLIDAGLDRDDLCRADAGEGDPVPTTYAFVTDQEWSEVVETRGCIADPAHPVVAAADRIVAG